MRGGVRRGKRQGQDLRVTEQGPAGRTALKPEEDVHVGGQAAALLRRARVGRLATADRTGSPHVIPICFVFDGRVIYTPIDEKPKRTSPHRLRRVRNIAVNPRVALVVDEYDEDWSRLRYILVRGTAAVMERGPEYAQAIALLRRKYPQYRRMRLEGRPVLRITPLRLAAWAARGESAPRGR